MNGGWSEWTPYSDCSVTCGSGMKTKTRECNNPAPKHGGKDCDGRDKFDEACLVTDCPCKLSNCVAKAP